ncbi:MAG TPA: hypothetical protein VF990_15850 [Candidatus Dormibacteraeota bacterium]
MGIARSRVLLVAMVLAAIACSNPSAGPPASGARLASPNAPGSTVDSKAADLRARLDLLLGEHVIVIAKDSLAATANRAEEYAGYATLLTINGNDLSAVMNSAFGASSGARFDQIWAMQTTYFVDYTVGIASHDAGKSNGAAAGLVNSFAPAFAQFMSSMTSIPLDPITQLSTEQVLEVKAIIDDQAALNNARMFMDLHRAFAQSARLGDALATAIANKFPDKFPGNPAGKAVDFRVSLDTLLQEHAYLATMTTSAATDGRSTEQAAALTALTANANSLGTLFSSVFGAAAGTRSDQVWGAHDAELVVYAGNADAATRQSALDSLTSAFVAQLLSLVRDSTDLSGAEISNAVQSQVADTIKVIDDQRSKSTKVVAGDDHTAAAATIPVADLIATATVAKLPTKF